MSDHLLSSQKIQQIILRQSKRANVGHIGSALSVVDILAALYSGILHISAPNDPDRDRFVMSKGHAALALYAVLHLKGWLSEKQMDQFCGDDTLLGVHPDFELEGIDFSTGSLGQGLSMGVGSAMAARLQNSSRRTCVLISDGECDEGSIWESVMFAAHHKISNLTAIVDLNGQQALGYTDKVLNISPLADRWRAFGWDVHEVDGHNREEMAKILLDLNADSGPPHVLIAKTVFGKGVSYMQSQIKWHYMPMSDQEYRQALEEIGVKS
ncbi:MAG: transketolase [Anaerolineae bacterium]|nr:transketolase [Anaerolineae bacterium]